MNNGLTIRRSRRAISLTALIDVVFILLMFFMLTSQFSRLSFYEFQTPAVGGGSIASNEAQALVLLSNGDLTNRATSQGTALSDSALQSQFDATRPLSVMPMGDADVQTIVRAIERLHQLGLSQVNLGRVLPSIVD